MGKSRVFGASRKSADYRHHRKRGQRLAIGCELAGCMPRRGRYGSVRWRIDRGALRSRCLARGDLSSSALRTHGEAGFTARGAAARRATAGPSQGRSERTPCRGRRDVPARRGRPAGGRAADDARRRLDRYADRVAATVERGSVPRFVVFGVDGKPAGVFDTLGLVEVGHRAAGRDRHVRRRIAVHVRRRRQDRRGRSRRAPRIRSADRRRSGCGIAVGEITQPDEPPAKPIVRDRRRVHVGQRARGRYRR